MAGRLTEEVIYHYLTEIPSAGNCYGDETKAKKETACKEWILVVLRTTEFTQDLKKRIEANNLFLCEQHLKAKFVIDREYWIIFVAHNMHNDMLNVDLFYIIEYS